MSKYILIFLLIPSLCFAEGKVPNKYDICEVFIVNIYCILKCSTSSADGGVALLNVGNSEMCGNN